MQWQFLSGDLNWQKDGGKFVSNKLNNGTFDYWLVVEMTQGFAIISAVSPDSVPRETLDSALRMSGLDAEAATELQKVDALSDYGACVSLWNDSGFMGTRLLQKAYKQAAHIQANFDRYMDYAVNAIGQNGWGAIRAQTLEEYFASRDKR